MPQDHHSTNSLTAPGEVQVFKLNQNRAEEKLHMSHYCSSTRKRPSCCSPSFYFMFDTAELSKCPCG